MAVPGHSRENRNRILLTSKRTSSGGGLSLAVKRAKPNTVRPKPFETKTQDQVLPKKTETKPTVQGTRRNKAGQTFGKDSVKTKKADVDGTRQRESSRMDTTVDPENWASRHEGDWHESEASWNTGHVSEAQSGTGGMGTVSRSTLTKRSTENSRRGKIAKKTRKREEKRNLSHR